MKTIKRLVIIILVINIVCAKVRVSKNKKSKRGILGAFGEYGLTYNIPPSGLGYQFGYSKHWPSSVYSGIPSFVKPIVPALPTNQYALTHGEASVASYNVNFPRYQYIQQKPLFAAAPSVPLTAQYTPAFQQVPQFTFQNFAPPVVPPPVATPSVSAAAPAPIFPVSAPSYIYQHKPIVPISVPVAPSVTTIHKPILFAKPIAPILPSAPANPIFTLQSIQPQLIPVPVQTQPPTLSSTTTATASPTTTTTQANPIGQPGTNFVTSANPDQQPWHPLYMVPSTHFLPTPASQPDVPRPPISLLPPYLGPTGPGFGTNFNFFTTTAQPNIDDDSNQQPQQSNNNFDINETNQGDGNQQNHHHHQTHHQNHQSNHHFNHHNSVNHHANNNHNNNNNNEGYGPFNGQGYDAPSNGGRYIGPSSYQVRLGTRREY